MKFYKGLLRLLKAYKNNVFDGKVTTLIGLTIVILGIVQGFRGAEVLHVVEIISFGLIVAGFRDPRLSPPGQNDSQKDS